MINFLNDKRVLLTVLVLQSLTLIAVIVYWQPKTGLQRTGVLAESYQDPDDEYRECLSRPVSERQICAGGIGRKLAGDQTMDSSEKIRNCMKLRPIFHRFCLD